MAKGQEAGGAVADGGAVAPPSARRSLGGEWGSIVVAAREVPIRTVVLITGIVVWLGLMFLQTGGNGITALWVSVLFLAPVVAIGSLTRSIDLRLIGQFVLVGGLGLTVAWIFISLFTAVVPDLYAPIRDFVVPPIEEATKFVPLLLVLWFGRRGIGASFGATDLLLMGAAIGTGFGLVELAYTTGQGGPLESVPLLPITEIYQGHLVVGHAIWAAIGGGMLGIGLLIRSRGALAIIVAGAGVAWTTLDHVAGNYSAVRPGTLTDLLLLVTANGWLSLLFFVAVLVIAIAMDLRIVRMALPPMPELAFPPLRGDARSIAAAWAFRIRRRGLAFAIFRGGQGPVAEYPERAQVVGDIAYRMLAHRRGLAPIDPPEPVALGNTP